tara:strand:- start:4487 stop:4951 length:465 start_codon:yes stop_codon:yes gene_type:complete
MKKFALTLAILLMTASSSHADIVFYDVTPPFEFHQKHHNGFSGEYAFRPLDHAHPYQWTNSSEGLELGRVNSGALVKSALDKKIIKEIAATASIGFVTITPRFKALSYRDQRVLAHAFDEYYREKRGQSYRLYLLRTEDGHDWGSYTKYGLQVY